MARHIGPDDSGFVYRALIEYRWPQGGGYTASHGPYTNIGQAKSQVTRETTGRFGRAESGRVQRAAIEWEDVK